jgi:hypothetical protein
VELIEKIRILLNKPWIENELFSDKVRWNKIYIALDTFDDANEVIDNYCKLPDFDAFSGGYLYIYGLLQAFMVQQDACINLSKAILNTNINPKIDYPNLYKVREIRNDTIGHPTSRGNDSSFHGISRITISKHAFTLRSIKFGKQLETNFLLINTTECLNNQRDGTESILQTIYCTLLDKVRTHMEKFSENKLQDLFKPSLHYLFEKVSDYRSPDSTHYAAFPLLINLLTEIKAGITARFGSIDPDTGAYDSIAKIEYIIVRLERDLIARIIDDKLELDIMIQALKLEFNQLKDICVNIDDEMTEIEPSN